MSSGLVTLLSAWSSAAASLNLNSDTKVPPITSDSYAHVNELNGAMRHSSQSNTNDKSLHLYAYNDKRL